MIARYYEYFDWMVDEGMYPSTLCYEFVNDTQSPFRYGFFKRMLDANRVYSVTGNTIIEHKNRNGAPSTGFISEEDKLVLRLKATLI
jgi:hypothetical protein